MISIRRFLPLILLLAAAGAHAQFTSAPSLQPSQLAIVINDAESNSVKIGEYYRKRRGIPEANVVHVSIPNKPHEISAERFEVLKEEIDSHLGPEIQAVLMVWTAPYKVECNSITGAYTLGFELRSASRPAPAGAPVPTSIRAPRVPLPISSYACPCCCRPNRWRTPRP